MMAASENRSVVQHVRSTKNQAGRTPPVPVVESVAKGPDEQDPGQLAMFGKAHEFFQICDSEDKGFITRRDMQRLHGELPLSLEELEKVFDTLDADGNGSLSLEEFTTGFSQFLFGENIPLNEASEEHAKQLQFENVYHSKWEESLKKEEDDEDVQFYNLIDSLGANRFLEDETHIKKLWKQLQKDEPHLLPNFEDLLARIFSQLHEANIEKAEIENALKRKVATYDEEIQNLYEEMEQQIKKEKERFLLQDTEKFQSRSQELEEKLLTKEQELEQLARKQKTVEKQCLELNNDKQETKVENDKLKLRNKEMRRELDRTSQELLTAQQQLRMLQEEASQLHEAREMEVYRVTESSQREKAMLQKQLNLLREMNKHLRDEHDGCLQKSKGNAKMSFRNQRSGSVIGKYIDSKSSLRSQSSEEDEVFNKVKRNKSLGQNGFSAPASPTEADNVEGGLSPNHPLQRIISIEEDDPPQHLDIQLERPLNKWVEEPENNEKTFRSEDTPSSPRGQPVGKETWTNEEQLHSAPDRFFKIVFVGNSSVGKTSFLRRFCEDTFYSGTSATVGIDYSVKTVAVDNCQVALQLWDTAGQERYRSITKQFFRKADGVIVMYDITAKPTFTAVRQWLVSVEEGAGVILPILLLGNKTDIEKEREVPNGLAEQLAKDCNLIFYECSACTGHNAKESVLHLARVLKEQEDKEKEKTLQLLHDAKKKSCCSRQ